MSGKTQSVRLCAQVHVDYYHVFLALLKIDSATTPLVKK